MFHPQLARDIWLFLAITVPELVGTTIRGPVYVDRFHLTLFLPLDV